ncbi:MAG TPA: tRNA pseudouridine(38-40) synthase TruA [Actinomycetota bacterium]
MKVALLVAYDGTDFHGFARQRTARTVQGVLEEALSMVLREPIELTCAGRTDAGVHASGQVVSFEAPEVEPERLQRRVNRLLAPEVSVRGAARASDSFDARFSARRRSYEYRCYRAAAPDPFLDRFALHLPGEVSVRAMRAGARALVGEHDFSAFCRKGQGSLVRRVRSITIVSAAESLTFKLTADSFCHQMVRSIIGLLLDVGRGKRGPESVAAALGRKDRGAAGNVAPARALHLTRVLYRPDPFQPF